MGGVAAGIVLLATYLFVAYAVLPFLWREREGSERPALDSLPKVTHNAEGIPGDPINIGLIGSTEQLLRAILAMGWRPADPVTFESMIEIAESVRFHRPDPDAPVSSLYLFGRKQDLAFEREVGSSAARRHHVRWWRTSTLEVDGGPLVDRRRHIRYPIGIEPSHGTGPSHRSQHGRRAGSIDGEPCGGGPAPAAVPGGRHRSNPKWK
jgi:hypothetical protein